VAINFHPEPGTILMCDFTSGFKEPEMVKKRPIVVISPNRKRYSGLCTVLAISSVPPEPIENWHYQIPKTSMPQIKMFEAKDSWIKGDMIYRVAFDRLELIKIGKDQSTGKRIYFKQRLGREQMHSIYSCVLHSLNLNHLPQYL
jgi:mRNA interferase MazF